VIGVAAVGMTACGHQSRPIVGARAEAATTSTTQIPVRVVAEVPDGRPSIDVYDTPGAPAPKLQLANPNTEGVKRVFLVEQQQGTDWLEVRLPVRPNGSTGWIKAADVQLTQTMF